LWKKRGKNQNKTLEFASDPNRSVRCKQLNNADAKEKTKIGRIPNEIPRTKPSNGKKTIILEKSRIAHLCSKKKARGARVQQHVGHGLTLEETGAGGPGERTPPYGPL